MRRNDPTAYLRLRLLVGYLGESVHGGWWASEYFSPSSRSFLAPIFARSVALAQYHGVREAARRVHDEVIGVGHVFHLFRLPEEWEQDLHRAAQDARQMEALLPMVSGREAALTELAALAGDEVRAVEGPIAIASLSAARQADTIRKMAQCYLSAFRSGARAFPYLTE